MSRIRGVIPVFLAVAVGIGNGLYVFGPALREEKQGKDTEERKTFEAQHSSPLNIAELEALKETEGQALGSESTPLVSGSSTSGTPTSSWWQGLWASNSNSSAGREPKEALVTSAEDERKR